MELRKKSEKLVGKLDAGNEEFDAIELLSTIHTDTNWHELKVFEILEEGEEEKLKEYLKKNKEKGNDIVQIVNVKNDNGQTPLYFACQFDLPSLCQILIGKKRKIFTNLSTFYLLFDCLKKREWSRIEYS